MDYNFRDDEFWKTIPIWKDVTREEFGDHKWQLKNSVTKVSKIEAMFEGTLPSELIADIEDGQVRTPMNVRITPYIFALIDWNNPYEDPLLKQFLPLGSQFLPNHPYHENDSLHEDIDSPVPLITHRYPDKVLFLPTTVCPVYCSYCTRSRLVGGSTESKEKDTYGANVSNWEPAFEYLRTNKEIEDVVISGGDAFMIKASLLKILCETLLDIPNIRRIRIATKGLAIFPQKILSDNEWVETVGEIHQKAISMNKQAVIHTHFSSPNEITMWSHLAMNRLHSMGIVVRNQTVLQEGVNNSFETMHKLIKQMSYINIQPYYIYQHDMVPGCEHFRTTLGKARRLEAQIRGTTAGYNMPLVICDLPGGGGKRPINSFELYDEEIGISAWRAPQIKEGKVFYYFDPINKLKPEIQAKWVDSEQRELMIKNFEERVEKAIVAKDDYEKEHLAS
ncbi:MAG: KamA family radical SAM protein [Flavobacteriales bacterium]|nr:KamA family radical SAM protein [Flavobacteriales bacterium]